MTETSNDRRSQVRLPVEICVQQLLAEDAHLGLTRDLSERGLYVNAPRLPNNAVWFGAPLQLEFALPGTGETIWARGQVCHEDADGPEDERGLGIRFIDMAERHARSLRDYVESIRRARLHNLLLQMQRKPQHAAAMPGVVGDRW